MIERKLDDKVSVAPQIAPEDVAALQEQGITALICNRPDSEVMPDLSSAALGTRFQCNASQKGLPADYLARATDYS